jgi:peptidoglycan-N-acetylglucosamine deacetylase
LSPVVRSLTAIVRALAVVLALAVIVAAGYFMGRAKAGPAPVAGTLTTAPPPAFSATVTPDPPPLSGVDARPVLTSLRRKEYNLDAYKAAPVTHASSTATVVALTFDDGPSPNTAEVLDILEKYDAGATFFFVGRYVPVYPVQARRVLDDGFEIGNHTWDHVELKGMTAAKVRDQVKLTEDTIERITGARPQFVRPHGGVSDETARKVIRGMGLVLSNWDAAGYDSFAAAGTPQQIEEYAVKQTKAGSIILLHETNPATVQALPLILQRLQQDGYRAVTLGELLTGK